MASGPGTGALTGGRTVVDLRRVTDRPVNAEVGKHIDREGFIELLRVAIASYD